ncbi:zinc-dependent alcohol dehydrogenase family protein [Streptomyces noursei]|uniref:zinc-dependent alcohol dehydrogenase family protein n=1 Tax=Streptomyces noursei TaxID=1971 RepID=UPI001678DE2A|nr:zinc-dependent alcohol dehydrogenase family protein [Streptomyces noursei]MCZ1019290.1 zinc-dependent alcohol dehydrogenase family protein [Streptomyces noursei]GGX30325.1 alcohol dehydrogenase [Streptomyces noursei]
MRAVVIEEPHRHHVTTVPDPTPGPGEVVVAVAAAGLCGTDVHMLAGEFGPTRYPVVPRHEFAGEVVAVGADVTGFAEGDAVAVDPALYCGACHFCALGRGNLCERWGTLGITVDGACAEYVAVPARNCHRLPETVPLAHAPLIEPLSTIVRGLDIVAPRLGDHFLIYGAGTMGLLYLQVARRAGAASVSVVDVNEERLAVARRLGADAVATDADGLAPAHPRGWEVVTDCTGNIRAIEDGLTRAARGGTFQQFGCAPDQETARFSPFRIYHDEIRIVGSMAILHSFGRAVELLGKGVADAETMITHRFGLDSYATALETFRRGTGRKLQIVPSGAAT